MTTMPIDPSQPRGTPQDAFLARSGRPLSAPEASLWRIEQTAPDDFPVAHESLVFRVVGSLDLNGLRSAVHLVIARHEALRSAFIDTPNGPQAVVEEQVADALEVTDLRGMDEQAANARANELIQEGLRRRFDLSRPPLLRVAVVKMTPGAYVIAFVFHQLVADARSIELFLGEFGRHYRSLRTAGEPAKLPDAPRGSSARNANDEQIDFWKCAVEDGQLWNFPLDRPRPAHRSFATSYCGVRVARDEVEQLLGRCARECASTDIQVLLAALALLLSRYTGQETVALGTTVDHRECGERAHATVGCLTTTAPLILNLAKATSFRELLTETSRAEEMLRRHGAAYSTALNAFRKSTDPSYNPVFQTALALDRSVDIDLGAGVLCQVETTARAAVGLDFQLRVRIGNATFEIDADFNTDLFNAETIERHLRHYVQLLKRLANDIDGPVAKVSFLPDDEGHRILDVWNQTRADYPRGTVVDMMERTATQVPDHIAAEYEGASLTYCALNSLANRYARLLREQSSDEDTPFVGVYMERSLEMVIALLAIVKAGLAYVPLDPEYPADRIRFMIADAGLRRVLTQRHRRADLDDTGVDVVVVDAAEGSTEHVNLVCERPPDSPVYLIYTSGSTGRPKGVINRHEALFNRLYWMQTEYGLTEDDRVLQKTPFTFDVSVWEFFWPLMFGARIVLARPGGHGDADYLKRLIGDRAITTVHFVPSMLNVFLEEDGIAEHCRSLRRVICSGEALPFKSVERFYSTLHCALHNLYGPTEAAIDVSSWACSLDYPGQIVPIGRPIANVKLYVVDEFMQLQPVGVPGELCIGGVALATGYHNRPDLTQKAFVLDPFTDEPNARLYRTGDLVRWLADGQIQYLGRMDGQIKLRGIRIEPEEISAVIKDLPNVKDAVVVVREHGRIRRLVAYIVARDLDRAAIEGHLAERLPDFMIPQAIVAIPSIPKTPNGKLDVRALPDPGTVTHRVDAASVEEQMLAKIWADVLALNDVGADTNFFSAGGDSILVLRVASRLQELGYAVEVSDLFNHPTIGELARVLESRRIAATGPSEAPLCLIAPADRQRLPPDVEDAWPLTMLQAGMIYHSMLGRQTSIYHDIFQYEFRGRVDPDHVRRAIRTVAAGHPQLRSFLDLATYSEPLQIVRTQAEPWVEIVDLQQRCNEDQDAIIERWVTAEQRRPFDIERDPLVRFRFHLRAPDRMGLAFAFHHAALDGWSVAVLVEEFRRVYCDLATGREPELTKESVPYSTYVNLERRALADAVQRSFWSQALAEFAPCRLSVRSPMEEVGLGEDPRPAKREVSQHVARALQTMANAAGVPLKSVYLALHVRALARLLDQPSIVTGLVTNGRPERSGEALAGLFLNTVPFPISVRGQTWHELVREVFEIEQRTIPHRRFPLAEIQRMTGTDAWFDTVFNFTAFHVFQRGKDDDVAITRAEYIEQTNFAAVVHVHRDYFADRMQVVVAYDPARTSDALVQRYLDEYLSATGELISGAAVMSTGGATAVQQRVASIIANALEIPHVDPDAKYRELGLDSINAIGIVAKLKRLNPELTMADVFRLETARELAEQVGSGQRVSTVSTPPARAFELARNYVGAYPPGVVDAYPSTALQLRMIRDTDRDVTQAAYHDLFSFRLAAPFNEALLRSCLQQLMNGHETFRTAFALGAAPVPMQLVYAAVETRLTIIDLRRSSTDEREAEFEGWFEREKRTGFAWNEPGLIRFFVHRMDSLNFVLTLSFHHAILDGWSLSCFVRDLIVAYVASLGAEEVTPTFPALKYRDYVRLELESRDSQAARDFWRQRLDGCLRNALPQPSQTDRGALWSETKVVLDAHRMHELVKLAGRVHVPLKYAMLAGHVLAVSLLCQEADVLTGVFTSARPEEDEGERILGLFLNFMPFRQRVGEQTRLALVREVFDNERECFPHRRYPLDQIEQECGREPLFETIFNYTHFKAYEDIGRGAELGIVTDARWFEHTGVPLLVHVGVAPRQQGLVLTLNANAAVIPQSTLEIVSRLYDAVLADLVEQPTATVSTFPVEVMTVVEELRKQPPASGRSPVS